MFTSDTIQKVTEWVYIRSYHLYWDPTLKTKLNPLRFGKYRHFLLFVLVICLCTLHVSFMCIFVEYVMNYGIIPFISNNYIGRTTLWLLLIIINKKHIFHFITNRLSITLHSGFCSSSVRCNKDPTMTVLLRPTHVMHILCAYVVSETCGCLYLYITNILRLWIWRIVFVF